MRSFLIYNLEVFLCLAVFYLFYQVGLKKETNHRFTRVYLISSLLFSFAIPFSNLSLLSLTIPDIIPTVQIPEFQVNASNQSEVVESVGYTGSSWLIFYATVSILLMIGLMREFLKIVRVKRNTKSVIEFFEGYKVIIHRTKFPTFSFMKTIYLSGDDLNPENSKQKILLHELSHIKGAHSVDVVFIELIRIFFWFNPMVYLYKNALILSHEYIADQYSVARGDQQNYVNLLVNQTLSNLGLSLGSHFGRKSGILSEWPWARSFSFNKSQTLKRIKMIKNKRKMNKLKYLIPVFAIMVSTIIVSCVENNNLPEVEESTLQVSTQDIRTQDSNILEMERMEKAGELFSTVDQKPEFPGGINSMYKFLGKSINYPGQAKRMGIEGRVFVQFVIDEDGFISNATAIKGIGAGCDKEAIKVINNMPKWSPGVLDGKKVKVKMVLPIFFKLNDSGVKHSAIPVEDKDKSLSELVVVSYKDK